jgi:hypothetical protein
MAVPHPRHSAVFELGEVIWLKKDGEFGQTGKREQEIE